jgi:thiosulfate/3-mercaptopyruvate sulfurtransferase
VTPFIDVPTLRTMLDSDRPPVVLGARWRYLGPSGDELFAQGHIPGSVYLDLDDDMSSDPGPGGRHPLPDPAEFAAAVRRAGVTLDRPVVVSDRGDGTIAARLWWLLRHHGHDDVSVLDGGFTAWVADGGDVEIGPIHAPYDDGGPETDHPFTADVARLPVIDAEGAAAAARSGVLLDARAPARYAGEVEPLDSVAGHIPGAFNAPTSMSVGSDMRLRDRDKVARGFANLGVTPGVEVAAYCGSGVTAAHTVLVLHHLGIEAALFPGSWSQWITDPERPIAVGSKPG